MKAPVLNYNRSTTHTFCYQPPLVYDSTRCKARRQRASLLVSMLLFDSAIVRVESIDTLRESFVPSLMAIVALSAISLLDI